mgnify:CR=1 FL=1
MPKLLVRVQVEKMIGYCGITCSKCPVLLAQRTFYEIALDSKNKENAVKVGGLLRDLKQQGIDMKDIEYF